MAELKRKPVLHSHEEFLTKAKKKAGFTEAYAETLPEYELAKQMLRARSRAGLTQDTVAQRMGTSKSAVSRLEGAAKHAPSLSTLQRYAEAVGCELQLKFVPQRVS